MRLLDALVYSSWHIRAVSSFLSSRARYHIFLQGSTCANISMEHHKRPRLQLSTMSSVDANANMKDMSPYEQRIRKLITACQKCHGEGKVRGNLSKKAKARKKDLQQNASEPTSNETNSSHQEYKQIQVPKKPCKECSGTGLSLHDPNTSTNSNMPPSNLHVAIIGGGIGGFALAAALQHRNIDFVVYERDLSFEERNQGYGLTMQQGARALRALGFMNDDFDTSDTNKEATNNPGTKFGIHSTRHAVHKPNGECIGEWGLSVWGGRYEKNGRSHATRQNAHISRQNLRRVLMDLLRPGSVRWGYRFMGYDESNDLNCNGDNALALKFSRRVKQADGTEKQVEETVHSSILVGCDGIRSAVRACKLGEEIAPLRYLGCIVILGIGPSPNDSLLTDGRTVFQTADGVTRLYAMPYAEPGEDVAGLETSNENGLSMWQLSFPMTERDADDLSKLGSAALKAEALRRCGKWHDPIPALLDSTPEQLVTGYPCYDRALVDKNDLRNGLDNSQSANSLVTMLGDAAHPMSPFKGQGANQALLDAVLLAQKIYGAVRKVTKTESTLDDLMPCALGEFENEMLQRCAVKVKKSAEAAKFLHSQVAIKEGNVTRGAAAVLV